MTFGEYQAAARRTQNPALKFFEMREHALCGLAAEVGEVHSIHQKNRQGHPIDMFALANEIGDVLWMLSELCDVYHLDLDVIAQMNIEKLKARYPEGFDEERSLRRKKDDQPDLIEDEIREWNIYKWAVDYENAKKAEYLKAKEARAIRDE